MFNPVFVSLALAASALANVFLTSPVASTVFTGGQSAIVSWKDDGTAPSLSQFGIATFAVYVGNANLQTLLQTIATSVDVSATSSVEFTPNPSIGPNGAEYFIRVTSQTYMAPASPQYFEEAFSAKFAMSSMSGTFNSSVQAEIDGQSTAPIGGATAASAASATGKSSATATTLSSAAKTSAATTPSTNAAGKPTITTGIVALAAALVGASLL